MNYERTKNPWTGRLLPPLYVYKRFDGVKVSAYSKVMPSDDLALIQEAQKDPAAFQALYQKYTDKIYSYLWYRVGYQKEVAEDLMQETFIKAFQRLCVYKEHGYSYGTFLLKIAHNTLIDYYRSHKTVSLDEIGDIPEEVSQSLEKKLEAEQLWRALLALHPHERDAVLMHYQDGMPIKEMALILGKSQNAIKLLLSRTRKKLSHIKYVEELSKFKRKKSPKKAKPIFS